MESAPDSAAAFDPGAPAAAEFTRTRADLARWRAGDAAAFDELWRRYRPALEVLIAGRIRVGVPAALRGRLDADDVVQEVAATVFAKLGEFEYRGPGTVLAWMSVIAQRTVNDWLDYWRAGKRHPGCEVPSPPGGGGKTTQSPWELEADRASGPATEFAMRERRRRLAAAMAGLSEREHVIVFWRYFGGASWTEIATELGAPSGEAVRKECYLKVFPALAVLLARNQP